MDSNQKFIRCNQCGSMAGLIINKSVSMVCCGEKMAELIPNTAEASHEKHLPVVTTSGGYLIVEVGSVPHPMEDEHHIAFLYVETENGGQRKCFDPGTEPKLLFNFVNDKPIAVYAYCNLHGLWKTEVK